MGRSDGQLGSNRCDSLAGKVERMDRESLVFGVELTKLRDRGVKEFSW